MSDELEQRARDIANVGPSLDDLIRTMAALSAAGPTVEQMTTGTRRFLATDLRGTPRT